MIASLTIVAVLLLVRLAGGRRAGFWSAVWVIVVASFPPWISVYAGGYRIPVAAVVSLIVLLTALEGVQYRRARIGIADFVVLALLVFVTASVLYGTPLHILTQVLLEWTTCYLAGRKIGLFTDASRLCLYAGGLIGALGVLQNLVKFNVASIPPFSYQSQFSFWSVLQERNESVRAELTFGHSIALGAVLAILFAFSLNQRGYFAVACRILMVLGIVATLSRSALIAVFVCVLLLIAHSAQPIYAKIAYFGMAVVFGSYGVSIFSNSGGTSGSGIEQQQSASYREQLLSLRSILSPIGLAPGGSTVGGTETYRWLGFYSIDNSVLFVALYSGWIAALIFVVFVLKLLYRALADKNWVVSCFVLSQLAVIVTVAPITQYQNFFWFFAGIGVSLLGGHVGFLRSTRRSADRPLGRRVRVKMP